MGTYPIRCRVVMKDSDFIMQNHRVHDVSVMPGVVFLDMVCRILLARGLSLQQAVIRNVLFTEPVVTASDADREIQLTIGEAGLDGSHPIAARSRWLTGGEPSSDWRDSVRAELVFETAAQLEKVDLDQIREHTREVRQLDAVYAIARDEGICHGPAMRCSGEMRIGGQRLLAQLVLDETARAHDAHFHVHPAKLDCSTLLAFGQTEFTDGFPFIPVFIERFRAPRSASGDCYIYVPKLERLAESGDVIENDYVLCDQAGNVIAEVTRLTCKRIRHPDLIRRLLEVRAEVGDKTIGTTASELQKLVAKKLNKPASAVAMDVGFYDLGLDSVALLELSEELQGRVSATLYPTLLFEFSNIESLARRLETTYGPLTASEVQAPVAERGTSRVEREDTHVADTLMEASYWASRWGAAPLPESLAVPRDLVVLGPNTDVTQCLQRRVVAAGGQFLQLSDVQELARVQPLPTAYVVVAPAVGSDDTSHAGYDVVRALAAVVIDRRPESRCDVAYAYSGDTPAAQDEALAAFARTIAAETPLLRCRAVGIASALSADEVARALLSEVQSELLEHDVRWLTGGRRETRKLVRHALSVLPEHTVWKHGGVYLISGGAGGIGRHLAMELAREAAAKVVLVGRSEASPNLVAFMDTLRGRGAELIYVRADVSKLEQARAAAEHARAVFGRIDGVIHCAGVLRDGLHFRKTREDALAVLVPKIAGALNLDAVTRGDELEHFALCSSSSAAIANPGQATYAFANAFLERFAEWRARQPGASGKTVAIGWPLWAEGGMQANVEARRRARDERGLKPLPTALALEILARGLAGSEPSFTVLYGEPRQHAQLALPVAPTAAPAAPAAAPAAPTAAPAAARRTSDIAIVGVSGRYPMAPDLGAFWLNLSQGRDCVSEVPASRWDSAAYFHPERGKLGRTYGKWGGFLEHADYFDHEFFGISRKEAERMDPQERLFLTESWRVMEDAGYAPEQLRGERIGVFAGVMWNHYQLLRSEQEGSAPMALHAAVANRVSFTLDLRGPSLAVDAMCSSSLAAIHLAVASLRRGDCRMAIAGGVNVSVHPEKYLQLASGQFLSDDGRCRAFGKGGTGYVPGEGVGTVLLKPLDRAIEDGDHVWAVIKGSSLNHSGRTSGFTVPSPAAQATLIQDALTDAAVDPRTIGYLEAHGTGTALGDPIEIEAVRQVFAPAGVAPGACVIGSVKSNIGHLESAAGIASVTKVLLQLKQQQIAPSLHATEPNPHIDFASSPVRVAQSLEPWLPPRDGGPRRAGVSAFGAGGTNVHIVLEEPTPPVHSAGPWQGPCIIVLSAQDDAVLRRYADALLRSLAGNTATLDDIAFTLQVGRRPMPVRLALVGRELHEVRRALEAFVRDQAPLKGAFWGAPPASNATGLRSEAGALWKAERYGELAALWQSGSDVDWRALYPRSSTERAPRRISLPTYPFREQRAWIGLWKSKGGASAVLDSRPAPRELHAAEPVEPSAALGDSVELRVMPPGIALVTMQDRANKNMFTADLLAELERSFEQIAAREDVKVVVLAGTPEVFSMGGTPEALQRLARREGRFTDAPFVYEGLLRCDRPVVSAMQGHASGGGFAFGLYADVVVLARESVYTASFLNYGFTPGMGATCIMTARLGQLLASEMFLTGLGLSGEELERRGCQAVFRAADEVLSTALGVAHRICQMPGAAARALKRELARPILEQLPDVIAREVAMHEHVLGSESLERVEQHFRKVSSFRELDEGSALLPQQSHREEAVRPEQTSEEESPVTQIAASKQAVVAALQEILCATLYLSSDEIDVARTFADMGVDSVGAVAIVRDLNERCGLQLDSVVIYDHPTIARLAEYVVQTAAELGALRSAAQRVNGRAAAPSVVSASVVAAPAPSAVRAAPAAEGAASAKVALRALPKAPRPSKPEAPSRVATEHEVSAAESALVGETRSPRRVSPSVEEVPSAACPIGTGSTYPSPAQRGRGEPGTNLGHEVLVPRPATDIAVIGFSGRFPDALDLDAFWANLLAGHCSIREISSTRWDPAQHFDSDPRAIDKTYSKWAAHLDGIDRFDAGFFQISPMEAERMDPQQRVFLEQGWAALEHAGYAPSQERRMDCGVFVGCAAGDYMERLQAAQLSDTSEGFLGSATSILAARIAYIANLCGPTVAIDTACSSSLVAVHMACDALRGGQCELALAGGVALMVTPQMHKKTSKMGILSPTGRSAPFDAAADGIVLGEGVGVVVLKRLDKALADGDFVHGVIRASGMNGDGKTNGITAPSAISQANLIRSVHERAGVSADDIGYVECHGTGTPLGDPIEVKALEQAFVGASAQAHCVLGSVKANVGHTTMAAGIAGFLKLLLALEARRIPPEAGFQRLNPKIDLTGTPFSIATHATDWRPGRSGVRIGAVSSFGFSGTNCHVVVAEPPPRARRSSVADAWQLVLLSARSPSALKERVRGLRAALDKYDLADIAFTLAAGRVHLPVRAAMVVRDLDELRQALDELALGRASERAVASWSGAELGAVEGESAEHMARALRAGRGLERTQLMSCANRFVRGESADWGSIYDGQGRSRVPLPSYPFEGESHWLPVTPVEAPAPTPGRDLLGERVSDVSPEQALSFQRVISPEEWVVVDHRIAGTATLPGVVCLEMAAAAAARMGVPLPVRISAVRWLRPLTIPSATTLELRLLREEGRGYRFTLGRAGESDVCASGRIEALTGEPDQVDVSQIEQRCTRRVDSQAIYAAFTAAQIEYGPSYRLLSEIVMGADDAVGKLVAPPEPAASAGPLRLHPSLLDAAFQTVMALQDRSRSEGAVPFALEAFEVYGSIEAPLRCCVRRQGQDRFALWLVDEQGRARARADGFVLRPRRESSRETHYLPVWRSRESRESAPPSANRVMVVYAPDMRWLAEAILAEHVAADTLAVTFDGAQGALSRTQPGTLDVLYFLASATERVESETSTLAFFNLVKAVLQTGGQAPALKVILNGIAPAIAGDAVCARGAALAGLARIVHAEHPSWPVSCLDIAGAGERADELARRIVREPTTGALVALRGAQRLERVFELAPGQSLGLGGTASVLKPNGVYFILGGAGGIGHALSRLLAQRDHAKLCWVGRRPLDHEIGKKLDEIEALGGKALYVQADASDRSALEDAVARTCATFGRINGAIHSALVLRDRLLARMDEAALRAVLQPKVDGAVNFHAALRREPLDFMLFFSSAASFVDVKGQANYAAASTFEDAFAHQLRNQSHFPVSVINWGFWGSVGAVATESQARRFAEIGVGSIEPKEGLAAIEQLLAANVAQALVIKAEPKTLRSFGLEVLSSGQEPPTTLEAEPPVASTPGPASPERAGGTAGHGRVRAYVRSIFAEVLKFREADLHDSATFETFGIDSLIGTKIVQRFEEDLGQLPATLLFEHMTIEKLTRRLLDTHGDRIPARAAGAVTGGALLATPASSARVSHGDALGAQTDIAIVGVSGRYPRASDIGQFWRNLRDGVDGVREVPPSRWNWREYFDHTGDGSHPVYNRWAGFIDDVDLFDPTPFNILPREAVNIDPQERLFLETAWSLLEQAGYLGNFHERMTGVFVGAMYGAYACLAATQWGRGELAGGYSAFWSIANRVSYTFDFQGPSFAVDSACSSSLTAVHLACESLRRGECRMAIAGGVSLVLHPAHFAQFCARKLLAGDSHAKAFDARADGFVLGEGVGAVLLKPLPRAIEDRDTIWGVVKGSAVNAGGKTSGYFVPNPNAQATVIGDAIKYAGVDPRTISYVEAHGAGTALGDPIEIAGLSRAMRSDKDVHNYCALGSVKTNIGHLEAAAGIAGLTKILLQLEHGMLAPSLHFESPNPKIAFAASPFRVQTELSAWDRPLVDLGDGPQLQPRRAGLSSLGAGGANAHLIIEEYVQVASATEPEIEHALLLSARTAALLNTLAADVSTFLTSQEAAGVTLAELAYTSQVGRREQVERLAILASSKAELAERLLAYTRGQAVAGVLRGRAAAQDPCDVDELVRERRYAELAQHWVVGGWLDWSRSWPTPVRRVPFPTSPFDRKRYWITLSEHDPVAAAPVAPVAPAPRAAPAATAATVAAVGAARRVEYTVDRGAFYCRDHRVRGARWLPGALLLEWVRAAGAKSGVTCIENARWSSAIDLESEASDTVAVELDESAGGGRALFRVIHGGRTCATGVVYGGESVGTAERLDVAALRQRCTSPIACEQLYAQMARGGLQYGDSFQVMRSLWTGSGECVARIERRQSSAERFVLDPALLDGVLQSVAALANDGKTYVPFELERLRANGALPDVLWVHVRELAAGSGRRSFALRVADERMNVVLEISRFEISPLGPAAPEARRNSNGSSKTNGIQRGHSAAVALRPMVEAELRTLASSFLLVEPHEVDLRADLTEAGYDSVTRVELLERINAAYGLELPPELIFDFTALEDIARHLVAEQAPAVVARYTDHVAREAAAPQDAAPTRQADQAEVVASVSLPVQAVTAEPGPAVALDEIAIVGIAGIMPGAEDLPTFWQHLRGGRDLTSRVPEDRADLCSDPVTRELRGGFLTDIAGFDAAFFRISPREASLMDPQQRLFLEVAWRCIEDAGYRPSALAGSSTGVFAGVGTADYSDLLRKNGVEVEAHSATGIAHSILPNRISHLLDLHGPSEAIDTACSSALVAVHRAVEALRAGECDLCIAGGVNALLSPALFVAFAKAGMLSPDGSCKTFSKEADGYVRGEGAGAVLLKPMAAALRDGDHVYAVVKGSAINHGGRTTSLTAPSPAAQARLLVNAYRRARIDPDTLTYIEAHGTGTKLGDPIEVGALLRAFSELYQDFGKSMPKTPRIALGSVKTNVGHLETAAGIAGLLKVILAMQFGELPPTLHFTEPNPYLRLEDGPFFVQRERAVWRPVTSAEGGSLWRAGVSSFGFGGTNAHVVLEARRPARELATVSGPGERILVLSAPDARALQGYAGKLCAVLADGDPAARASVAYTLQVGREEMSERLAIVCSESAAAIAALERFAWNQELDPRAVRGTSAGAQGQALRAGGDLDELARHWVAGGGVDWLSLWPEGTPQRMSLPSFPFNKVRHWFTPSSAVASPARVVEAPRARGSKVRLTATDPAPPRNPEPRESRQTPPHEVPVSVAPSTVSSASARHSAAAEVVDFLVAQLLQLLGIDRADLRNDLPFGQLGLDSIYGMDLIRRVNAHYALDLKAAAVYEHDTVERLSRYVAGMMGGQTSSALPAERRPVQPPEGLEGSLLQLIETTLGRPQPPAASFASSMSSFDMLRTITALERSFGTLRKSVLFEHATVAELAAHLQGRRNGTSPKNAGGLAKPAHAMTQPAGARPDVRASEPIVLAKSELAGASDLARTIAEIEAGHGKEGGLPGRNIAPFIFLGSKREGYFNLARRAGIAFAFSYVGSAEYLPELAAEFVAHARAGGFEPSLLSMVRLEDVAGTAFTATPFGVIQRLESLATFSCEGGKMRRLRYLVEKFARSGRGRTVEYAVGTDRALDQRIAALIDSWGATKKMVNPYVQVVRGEIAKGQLAERHRMFLTYLDEVLTNALIVTRIPSEDAYLLDLEFYGKDAPLGGLEFALVQIFEKLVQEGCSQFSFGATFGVKAVESPNTDAVTEATLAELRAQGLFNGEGNFQFKNKFRPRNLPIYLCRPRDSSADVVSEIILMIASPDVSEEVSARQTADGTDVARREGILREHGYNPLTLEPEQVELDLVTDSWAECELPEVRVRMAELQKRDAVPRFEDVTSSLFGAACNIATGSGRAAEELLLRVIGREGQAVLSNACFPSWTLNCLDRGLVPVEVQTRRDPIFRSDLDLQALETLLATREEGVAFVCLEASCNARGGYPISMANVRETKRLTAARGVPLVIDATRVVENAISIAAHEPGYAGREPWSIVRELLSHADAFTLSTSKDFAVNFGGIVGTNDVSLGEGLREQVARRGASLHREGRNLLALALDSRDYVLAQVVERMRVVETIHRALASVGAPVVGPPGAHGVLLDTAQMPQLRGARFPVAACLAWLFKHTGIRGAPHLAGQDPGAALGASLRLAIPLGLGLEAGQKIASRIAALFRSSPELEDLELEAQAAGASPATRRYRPPAQRAETNGHLPSEPRRRSDENAELVREYCPSAERRLVPVGDGRVECFVCGRGPTVLLLHPFNIGAGYFVHQIEALAERWRVIVLHHPGVGATTSAADLSLKGLAMLIRDTLKALDVSGPIHVVGCSVAGLIAQAYALEYPEATASLTLVCSSYRVGNRSGPIAPLSQVVDEDFANVNSAGGSGLLEQEHAELKGLLLRAESMNPQIGLRYLDEFELVPDLLSRLPKLEPPCLIVQGKADGVIPEETRRTLRAALPRARYVEIKGAGHFPCLTHPEHMNQILSEFLLEYDTRAHSRGEALRRTSRLASNGISEGSL
jgi:acyl transferase domain-containing protein/tryptophanase/pimeloyl-ACP methyl ester carboxylesterase/NAD(P)-dependent dehydrogenase (short-subunit alcohol dehydrogenase family)